MESNQVVTPAMINTELAKAMLDHAKKKDPTDITTDGISTTKDYAYINSSYLSEKDSDQNSTKPPGRQSAYKITQNVERLKTLTLIP